MKPLPERDLALDAMRGITLALMTIVNRSIEGVSWPQLEHAAWDGLTLTDLVFPSFLFVVGAALAHTLPREGAPAPGFHARVLRRTAVIFLCGVLLNAFPFFTTGADGSFALLPLSHWRIPGVLERIALCYGAAALLLHHAGARGAAAYALIVLPLYAWLLPAFGDLSLEGNLPRRIDLALLGEGHLYTGFGIPFDPEGLLSGFPALANALVGWRAASLVRRHGARDALGRIVVLGLAVLAAGIVAAQVVPLNKALWSSSYTLVSGGIATLAFALLVAVVDLARWRSWTAFFLVLGRNTLALYLLGELLDKVLYRAHIGGEFAGAWIYGHVFHAIEGGAAGAFLYAIAFLGCVWLVGYALDRRGIHLRA